MLDEDGKATNIGATRKTGPREWQPWKPWTESEVDTLRRMAEQGATRQEIAAKLGRSAGGVKDRATRLNIRLADSYLWSESKTATLREMAADGANATEIAAVIGMSRNAVIGRAHRLNIAWKYMVAKKKQRRAPAAPPDRAPAPARYRWHQPHRRHPAPPLTAAAPTAPVPPSAQARGCSEPPVRGPVVRSQQSPAPTQGPAEKTHHGPPLAQKKLSHSELENALAENDAKIAVLLAEMERLRLTSREAERSVLSAPAPGVDQNPAFAPAKGGKSSTASDLMRSTSSTSHDQPGQPGAIAAPAPRNLSLRKAWRGRKPDPPAAERPAAPALAAVPATPAPAPKTTQNRPKLPEPTSRPTIRYRPMLPAKPEPDAAPDASQWGPVSIFAAGPFHCRFPVTEVHPLADFRFCGARAPFYGYCPAHQAQMWSRRR
jgi:hypothetical protein